MKVKFPFAYLIHENRTIKKNKDDNVHKNHTNKHTFTNIENQKKIMVIRLRYIKISIKVYMLTF